MTDVDGNVGQSPGGKAPRLRWAGDVGRMLLSAVLPGSRHLLAGRPVTGGLALLVWLGALWILIRRWDRVRFASGGALDERVALATLLVSLAVVWVWSVWTTAPRVRVDGPGRGGQWSVVVRAFQKNRLAVLGLAAIAGLYLVALLTPFLAPYDPLPPGDLATRLSPLSAAHRLGTDHLARDVLSRLLYGSRVSLSIGFIAVAIAVTLGTLVGAVAGYLGGLVDGIVMRLVDMVISFPRIVLLITIIALIEPSIFLIIVVLGFTQWPQTARIVRGEVLSLRKRDFVQAARAMGYTRRRIILRHVIPNAMAPVIVAATLGIGETIVLEAGLSFLGLGVQAPQPSWGTMVADGRLFLLSAWWMTTFPGLAIVVTVLSFNLVGDGLRDALDPRLRS